MIDYSICEYGEFAGRPMVRVTFDDYIELKSADEIVDELVTLLATEYNPTGAFVHQFTEQDTVLCFDGYGKHDPMNHQSMMVEVLLGLNDLPLWVLIHTPANIPVDPILKGFVEGEKCLFAVHFVVDLQTFMLTGSPDLVRTDIIKAYLCDLNSHRVDGSLNIKVVNSEAWNEVLAYTAILQAKLFIERYGVVTEKMIPVWIYPTTEELATESMKRGFNTYWRPCDA